jgi:hypothetical protein
MALVFCDGFDHYTSAEVGKKWSAGVGSGGSIHSSHGRYGKGFMAQPNNPADESISVNVPITATGVVGVAYQCNYGNATDSLLFVNEGAIRHLIVYYDGTYISVKRGDGTVLGTGTKRFLLNDWRYYELKFTIHDSTGSFELRVNGETSVSATGVDTKNGGTGIPDRVALGTSSAGSTNHLFDDFYAASGATFLGDVRVQSILPSGAGNTTQWTASAGSNYECVDDADPNGDTDYVSETTASEKDTYAFGSLTPTSGTIAGVQVMAYARKDDAGSRSIAPVYRPASTDYDGATVTVGDSYTYYREITEVSPETSAAWTIAEVNGAEFGVKLIA